MSRLDQHVLLVQNKLTLGKFLDALARAVAVFGVIVLIAIVIDRVFQVRLPRLSVWLWSGLGSAAALAAAYAIWRRPGAHEAAVKIDERLNTRDKFATALHARGMNDEFAHAALLDAERTADNVSLHKRFPLSFPRAAYATVGVAVLVLATLLWLPTFDLFGKEEQARRQAEQTAKVEQGKRQLKDALAQVAAVPAALQKDEKIQLAKANLELALKQGATDPARSQRTAAKALQDVNEAIKQQIKNNAKYAEAQNDAKMLRQLQVPKDETGPVADAQRAIAKGDFSDAVNELSKLGEKFDKMDKAEQDKAAQQMKNLANQLQQMAQNPQVQQQLQQQMQQMGMNQQQMQQAQQLMQQAAQGNPQAQQQMQQMAQQMMKQMNNGQGPNPQQQQQIQQMMQQMQAQMNNQQQAQQMQQAAQQMAQAMQQAAQQQGQQGQQNQQGGQQQAQQQMNQGAQQMQQQLQQMQAVAQDMQQIAAAQQNAANAARQAMNGMNGQQGQQGQDAGGGQWQGAGDNQGGDQNRPWDGQARDGMAPTQGGQGAGDRSAKQQAPYAVKPEMDPSQDDEKGRILATTLVKGDALKGESKEALKEVTESALKEAAEEVDQDRVSRQAQRVVREYFSSMQKDTETGSPTTAPSK
jgi:hypothetical protein